MEKFEGYNDVLNRLIKETVACTPQEWAKGTLTIDCDGHRIDYKLKNEDEPGKAVISDKLRALAEELYVRMANSGDKWIQAVLTYKQEGNSVNFKTDFSYPQPASNQTIQPADPKSSAPPPPQKPWWKFGHG